MASGGDDTSTSLPILESRLLDVSVVLTRIALPIEERKEKMCDVTAHFNEVTHQEKDESDIKCETLDSGIHNGTNSIEENGNEMETAHNGKVTEPVAKIFPFALPVPKFETKEKPKLELVKCHQCDNKGNH